MSFKKVIYLLEHWLPPGTPGSTGGTLFNYQFVEALSRCFEVEVIALNAPVKRAPSGVALKTFKERRDRVGGWRFVHWRSDLLAQIPANGAETILITTTATNAIVDEARHRRYETLAVVQAYEDFGFAVPNGNLREKLAGLKRLLASGQGFSPSILGADRVIVNSEYMRASMASCLAYRNPMAVLYPPLTLPLALDQDFSSLAERRVGFVNRAGKNLSFVLDLARATPDFEFLIFGHPIDSTIKMPNNVLVRGWASDRQGMFKEAKTWIMPSKWSEPFGLVAVEALSQGCRVGVSDRGGLGEAVGTLGRVFSGFDLGEWRTWLQSEDPNLLGVLREEHFRKCSVERFNSMAVELVRRKELFQ